ncbi:MAG TPA: hypothetical protein VEK57_03160 [Thermoanaerobaculia bacterium]|nr:hypothetical protein [Thermoanaerobaculia bacterium]
MSLTRTDLAVTYGLRENLQLNVTLPYDVKALQIRYTTLDGEPFTPPYGDIHHRTETLTGISDAAVGVDWRVRPGWLAGAGVSLPIGHTEPNPIVLGREGEMHQHIQFGSGTLQPRLSLQYVRPGQVAFVGRAEARLSLYENGEGFRAPATFLWSAGPSMRIRGIGVDGRFEGQHQTLGRWDGEIDEGSGFTNGGFRVGVSFSAGELQIAPSVYRELFSHGQHEETFQQGTTWSLTLSRRF